jgi:hypothetical protein
MTKQLNLKTVGFHFVLLVGLAVGLAGCGGKTTVESDLGIKGAPDWVNEGTNILNDKDGRLFHGVGSAPPMGDMSLQQSTADNRARAEVARVLSTYMEVVSSDYLASAGGGADAVTEQSVSRDINAVTKINLSGARVIGRWRNKRTNVIYSIVELDMKHVKDVVSKVDQMNEGLRSFILSNGDNIFDRVAKQ